MADLYQILADMVLAIHVLVVVFVILGLVLILAGNYMGWHWVNNVWFRLAHVGAIGTVVAEAWLGIICPLTTLEMWLRSKAGLEGYTNSFIEHWLQQILYYDAPAWVFITAYTLFGLLVLASWWWFPPRRRKPK